MQRKCCVMLLGLTLYLVFWGRMRMRMLPDVISLGRRLQGGRACRKSGIRHYSAPRLAVNFTPKFSRSFPKMAIVKDQPSSGFSTSVA